MYILRLNNKEVGIVIIDRENNRAILCITDKEEYEKYKKGLTK